MASSLRNVVPHDAYLCQYNSYTFDPAATYTESFNARPELDAARRTVKYVRTNLSIHTIIYVAPTTTIDASMEQVKQILTSQGGALYFRDKGAGDFNINVPGGQKKDSAWGPIPTHFNAKPLADSYAWELSWGVEVCIPWCDSAKFENAIAEWVYRFTSDKSPGGYETRRINGHIEIPMTRTAQQDRLIRLTADDYREVITPTLPRFFRPGPSSFGLSEDRRRLDFNFTYEQLPGPVPPPGVLKVQMSDSIENDTPRNFVKWLWSLSADYELMYGTPHIVAWTHFLQCRDQIKEVIKKTVKFDPGLKGNDGVGAAVGGMGGFFGWLGGLWARGAAGNIGAAIDNRDPKGQPANENPQTAITIFPIKFTGRNPDRFAEPKCSFSLLHTIVGTLPDLLVAGLWTQLPGDDDFDAWAKSAVNVFGPRGIPGFKFDPGDDIIVDLCRNDGISTLRRKKQGFNRLKHQIDTPFGPIPVEVDENNSWIHYENDLEVIQHDSVLVHKPIPEDHTLKSRLGGGPGFSSLHTPNMTGSTAGNMAKYFPPEDQGGIGFRPGSGATAQEMISTIARQAASTYEIVMSGFGVRLGFPVTPPNLVSIAGVPATAANDPGKGDGTRATTLGNVGVPIYMRYWHFRYLLPCAPVTKPTDPDTQNVIVPNAGGQAGNAVQQGGAVAAIAAAKAKAAIAGALAGQGSKWGINRF